MEEDKIAATRGDRLLFLGAGLFLAACLVLIFLSWSGVCTTACAEGHNYRIFGLKFELFGIFYFGTLLAVHIFSYKVRSLAPLIALLIASGLGAETWFLYVQKMLIGSWCPVCLLIAASLFCAALLYALLYWRGWFEMFNKGEKMKVLKGGIPSIAALAMGFTLAFMGTTKINPLQAAQESLKQSIAFGDSKSPIEVYLFTDWFCPACRIIEPDFEKMVPSIEAQAKLFFIDATLHPESLNFTPYNLSFMVNNKPQYLELRRALQSVADKTETPTEAQVREAIAPLGITYQELNFSDVTLGVKLFKKLGRQFGIHATPILVIINIDTKKGKKLSGTKEITAPNVVKAIESLR